MYSSLGGSSPGREGQLKSLAPVSLYHGVTGRINVPVPQLPAGSHIPSAVQTGAGAHVPW